MVFSRLVCIQRLKQCEYPAHSSGKMVSSGICDVVIASVYSETRLKKLIMITITSNTKTI